MFRKKKELKDAKPVKTEQRDRKVLFEQEALPHTDAMYAVALRLTGNQKEAEDLVQDAMLRGFKFFERFEQGTNIKAWLLKIMTNIFLNNVKRTAGRPSMVEFETVEDFLGEVEDDLEGVPSGSSEFRELLDQDVARALDELPVEYRTPVLLSAIEGLSYREIAQAMECPVGTVMSRLYRGRKMLERTLRSYARTIGFLKGEGAR